MTPFEMFRMSSLNFRYVPVLEWGRCRCTRNPHGVVDLVNGPNGATQPSGKLQNGLSMPPGMKSRSNQTLMALNMAPSFSSLAISLLLLPLIAAKPASHKDILLWKDTNYLSLALFDRLE